MSDLKRCPFCGDEVEIVPTGLYHWKYAIRHKSKTECILDGNAFALPYEKAEAVRMWNTRADLKTEQYLVKSPQKSRDSHEIATDEPQTKPKWTCARCGFENHSDFVWCFKCGFHKPETDQTERSE